MRFNIKESVETDSEGNPLSPEQVAFFKNSKIRDGQGRLLVCYHYSPSKFNTFNTNLSKNGYVGKGFYFSPDKKIF